MVTVIQQTTARRSVEETEPERSGEFPWKDPLDPSLLTPGPGLMPPYLRGPKRVPLLSILKGSSLGVSENEKTSHQKTLGSAGLNKIKKRLRCGASQSL